MLVVFLAVGLSLNLAQAIPPMEMSKVAQLFSSWPLQGVTLQQIRLLEATASAGPARDGLDSCGFFDRGQNEELIVDLFGLRHA